MKEFDSEEEIVKEQNPFSYKKFLSHSKSTEKIYSEEFFDVMLPSAVSRKCDSLVILDDDKPEENPYSIKKFVVEPKFDDEDEDEVNAADDTQDGRNNAILDLDLKSVSHLLFPEEQKIKVSLCDINEKVGIIEVSSITGEADETDYLRRTIDSKDEELKINYLKIAEMETEIENLKKREAEESAALEKIVQKVEKNLEITTARAVHAESQVSKLKEEVKSLQLQLKLREEQLTKESSRLEEVSVDAQNISIQMKTAAKDAEAMLKSLLGGTSKLKLLSELVSGITKVSEES